MAISIDWSTRVIYIPRNDLTLVQSAPSEIRELDLNWFRIQLKNLEDSEVGMAYPDTHRHNTTVTVGGFTLARVIEIINNFTITFEDGQYAVNLTGANSNVGDKVNVNQVSVRSSNSAGMIVVDSSGSSSSIDQDAIHAALDTYLNKNLYKADITSLAKSSEIDSVDTMLTLMDGKIGIMSNNVSSLNITANAINENVDNVLNNTDAIITELDTISNNIGTNNTTVNSKLDTVLSNISNIDIPTPSEVSNAVWNHSSATQLIIDVAFIKNIEGGKWELKNNQMIFYTSDNITEIARFNLYNGTTPSIDNVTRRDRV